MAAGNVFSLVKEAGQDWIADKAPRLSAATAYYTILSLAPLLMICLSIAGLVFGRDAAQSGIIAQFKTVAGESGAKAAEELLKNANQLDSGLISIVIGVVMLLIGASAVFGELQDAFNTVWNAPPRPNRGFWGVIRDRFLSFAMVLSVGFLLLVSMVLSTILSSMSEFAAGSLPGSSILFRVLELAVSFAVITSLFALLFKYLPDVQVPWREVWIGAAITAALFTVGKYLIGLYLGRAAVATPFGAAGSVVALVVWVYYSAMILFYGGELTQALSRRNHPEMFAKPNDKPAPIGTY
jgi:membrane protein